MAGARKPDNLKLLVKFASQIDNFETFLHGRFFQLVPSAQFTADDFLRQGMSLRQVGDRNLARTLVTGIPISPGTGDHIGVKQAGLNGDVIPAIHA